MNKSTAKKRRICKLCERGNCKPVKRSIRVRQAASLPRPMTLLFVEEDVRVFLALLFFAHFLRFSLARKGGDLRMKTNRCRFNNTRVITLQVSRHATIAVRHSNQPRGCILAACSSLEANAAGLHAHPATPLQETASPNFLAKGEPPIIHKNLSSSQQKMTASPLQTPTIVWPSREQCRSSAGAPTEGEPLQPEAMVHGSPAI